jgi:hypothetical protein
MKIDRFVRILLSLIFVLLVIHANQTRTAVRGIEASRFADSLAAIEDNLRVDSMKEELRTLLDLVCLNRELEPKWKKRLACQDSAP